MQTEFFLILDVVLMNVILHEYIHNITNIYYDKGTLCTILVEATQSWLTNSRDATNHSWLDGIARIQCIWQARVLVELIQSFLQGQRQPKFLSSWHWQSVFLLHALECVGHRRY